MASVIYQVFVDRFARGSTSPRAGLRDWHAPPEEPPRGTDHYGGDLDGLASKLDHLVGLGADAVYLTPIFAAPSNHKYDTTDCERVDASFGGDAAFDRLAAACRARGLGLILDGVFNHVGETHAWTRERRHLLRSSVWRGYGHLPEVDLAHPEARAHFFGADGGLARWTRRGATGWRLDCANDLGPEACSLAARAARAAGATDGTVGTVGELMAYPAGFTPGGDRLDGVMNY